MSLTKYDIDFLVNSLRTGKDLPTEYKYALFPTKQKEYELVYAGKARKEDVLADNEEAKAVPLQVEKIFNGKKYPLAAKDWHNILVFGDNLHILKTFYKDEDPLIKGKIKGKVKLIYIDPPFGTGDEYDGNKGQSAYSARRKGADYVEFVRRRLILLYELLDNDGLIFVRQGYNFCAYIKVVLDEVFGKQNFLNEIIVNRGKQRLGGKSKYSTATDTVFLYAKSDHHVFYPFKRARYDTEAKGSNMMMKGERKPPERIFLDPDGKKVVLLPPPNRHWKFIQSKIDIMYSKGVIYLAQSQKGFDSGIRKKLKNGKLVPVDYVPSFRFDDDKTIDSNWSDISGYSQSTQYPTENSEDLLYRVISTGTQRGDLVLDCFAGSGTTLAVAEKLHRRWIGCDIGKLSLYTTQKRLLQIDQSKDLENPKKKYSNPAKSFAVVTSGLYDLKQVFGLKENEYINFVKRLFEVEDTKIKSIGGVSLDGKRREFYVKIFPYWSLQNATVDEKYLQELHRNIGQKIGGRLYIIAPANNVHFISDYHVIGDVRYYFLKVPYQIIKELHRVQFKKLRQPQSKGHVNDLDEAIGFHFIRQPEVKTQLKTTKGRISLQIKQFESAYAEDEVGGKLKNFESLAMVLLDLNYNGETFLMTKYYFAQDLLSRKGDLEEKTEDEIRTQLQQRKEISLELDPKECGKQIVAVYVDIYGNEFRESFRLK